MNAFPINLEVLNVLAICREWAAAGKGDECFWEPFPGCPSKDELTPNMVIRALHEASDPGREHHGR